jgi:ATP-dependent DNA ligase
MRGEFFYKNGIYQCDPTGWWFSEKYDGNHAIWTGSKLISRNDNEIIAPKWWCDYLPNDVSLAGELYIDRKRFCELNGITLRKIPYDEDWKKVRFMVFDIPDAVGYPFHEVYEMMNELNTNIVLHVTEQHLVTDFNQYIEQHKKLVSCGAEGTVLRDPYSVYTVGVSDRLLKFKSQVDAETKELIHIYDRNAIIIDYKTSDKWYKDSGEAAMKSLVCCWEDDKNVIFSVSGGITKDQKCDDYKALFPVNTIINVLYNEINEDSGKPRFPRIS